MFWFPLPCFFHNTIFLPLHCYLTWATDRAPPLPLGSCLLEIKSNEISIEVVKEDILLCGFFETRIWGRQKEGVLISMLLLWATGSVSQRPSEEAWRIWLQHCREGRAGGDIHRLIGWEFPTRGSKYLACPRLPCACFSVLAKVSRQRNREAWVLEVGSSLQAKESSSLLYVNPEVGCINMDICYGGQCITDHGSAVHTLGSELGR